MFAQKLSFFILFNLVYPSYKYKFNIFFWWRYQLDKEHQFFWLNSKRVFENSWSNSMISLNYFLFLDIKEIFVQKTTRIQLNSILSKPKHFLIIFTTFTELSYKDFFNLNKSGQNCNHNYHPKLINEAVLVSTWVILWHESRQLIGGSPNLYQWKLCFMVFSTKMIT